MDLTGRLVRLRALVPEDAPALVELFADPEVVRYTANWTRAPYNLAAAQQLIDQREEGVFRWAVESLQDASFLGTTELTNFHVRNRHCDWGICIGPPGNWGKGFGTEACTLAVRFAFHDLGMEKVYLSVIEDNKGGVRSYEKAGFKIEGVMPRHVWRHGRFLTSVTMAVYRENPLYAAPD